MALERLAMTARFIGQRRICQWKTDRCQEIWLLHVCPSAQAGEAHVTQIAATQQAQEHGASQSELACNLGQSLLAALCANTGQ
jgi:hypothetical protein